MRRARRLEQCPCLHSSFLFLLAEPDGPNHGGDPFSFGTGKSDTLADTITTQKDQRKGDLITADVETQCKSNGKRPTDVPLTFKVLLWRSTGRLVLTGRKDWSRRASASSSHGLRRDTFAFRLRGIAGQERSKVGMMHARGRQTNDSGCATIES